MSQEPAGPILIAGGGIGGLAAALALARKGLPSHVLERRDAFSEEGAGIQIGPNGTRILEEIGAAAHLIDHVAVPDSLQVRDGKTGAELTRLPLGSWLAQRHGAPYWTVHRQDLHAALLAASRASPLITLTNGVTVTGAKDRATGTVAVAKDGREREGRALIAADGLWSALRGATADDAKPRPAGKTAYRTVIPVEKLPSGLTVNDVHIWLTEGAHVVHYPVRAGREHAFVIILDDDAAAAGWSTPVEAAFVRARARNLAPSLRALLEAGSAWRLWSLQQLAVPLAWARGHVALLGDAAHPVLPFLAQGAVLSLEDAAVLADELATAGDGATAQGLARYEARRRARALRVQAASRRNGRIYHLAGFMALARNNVLRTTPPALLMRQYDWLYGWKAS